jgi:hypothetical protein
MTLNEKHNSSAKEQKFKNSEVREIRGSCTLQFTVHSLRFTDYGFYMSHQWVQCF